MLAMNKVYPLTRLYIYAGTILRMCQSCVASPAKCVSNKSPYFKKVIHKTPAHRVPSGLGFIIKIALLANPVIAGLVGSTAVTVATTSAAAQSFEIVSVKPSGPSKDGGGPGAGPCASNAPQISAGRFSASSTTLYAFISLAYGLGPCPLVPDLLSGGPSWIRSDRFDIEAVMAAGSPTYTLTQLLRGNAPTLQAMLQSTLADRFKVETHQETIAMPVYALTLAKGGPKLRIAKDEDTPIYSWRSGPDGQSTLSATKMSMSDLTKLLQPLTGRLVVDRTALPGEFNFEAELSPLNRGPLVQTTGPSLFTALEEQLGLKLETARAPVPVRVIDQAKQPMPN